MANRRINQLILTPKPMLDYRQDMDTGKYTKRPLKEDVVENWWDGDELPCLILEGIGDKEALTLGGAIDIAFDSDSELMGEPNTTKAREFSDELPKPVKAVYDRLYAWCELTKPTTREEYLEFFRNDGEWLPGVLHGNYEELVKELKDTIVDGEVRVFTWEALDQIDPPVPSVGM